MTPWLLLLLWPIVGIGGGIWVWTEYEDLTGGDAAMNFSGGLLFGPIWILVVFSLIGQPVIRRRGR